MTRDSTSRPALVLPCPRHPASLRPWNSLNASMGGWSLRARASVGYWVAASRRRQGHASAALELVVDWVRGTLRITHLELFVEPSNLSSQRTAERAGFTFDSGLRERREIGGQITDVIGYSVKV